MWPVVVTDLTDLATLSQHLLLSAAATTLSLRTVAGMSDEEARTTAASGSFKLAGREEVTSTSSSLLQETGLWISRQGSNSPEILATPSRQNRNRPET